MYESLSKQKLIISKSFRNAQTAILFSNYLITSQLQGIYQAHQSKLVHIRGVTMTQNWLPFGYKKNRQTLEIPCVQRISFVWSLEACPNPDYRLTKPTRRGLLAVDSDAVLVRLMLFLRSIPTTSSARTEPRGSPPGQSIQKNAITLRDGVPFLYGAQGDRTPDLIAASDALSQLS